ncbi:hypothetical protein E5676_scaffold455G001650 [Cucumis melo var. makuwa]|uniref:Uncharacterized protein n=1 Tax=Cucumis melo var. makuwa TaxID=1194695 RepID=A0A5D3E5P6_CUCMM|nr:hypothetical protein E5676_scaffold455G001650 [Cucumis melo var. makuwa]
MEVVSKFYDASYHPSEFYVTIEGKKVFFDTEAINELYDLPNDAEYPRQAMITKPTKGRLLSETLGQPKDLEEDKEDELPPTQPQKRKGASTSRPLTKKTKVDGTLHHKPLKVIHPLAKMFVLTPRKSSNIFLMKKVSILSLL